MSLIQGFEHFVLENEPLAPYTTLRLGGAAEYFAEPTSEDELVEIVKRFREADMPIKLLGGGSNVVPLPQPEPSALSQRELLLRQIARFWDCRLRGGWSPDK